MTGPVGQGLRVGALLGLPGRIVGVGEWFVRQPLIGSVADGGGQEVEAGDVGHRSQRGDDQRPPVALANHADP